MGQANSQVTSPSFAHFHCANLLRRLAPVDGARAGRSTPRQSKHSDAFGPEDMGVDQKGCGALFCCRMLEIIAELVLQVGGSDFSNCEVSPAVRATGYTDGIDVLEKFGQISSCEEESHAVIICGEVAHVFLIPLVAMPVEETSSVWTAVSGATGDAFTSRELRCRLILAGDWMDAHGADSDQSGPQTVVWHGLDGFTKSSGDSVEARILWRAMANMWANGDVVPLHREDLLKAAAQWGAIGALQLGEEAGQVTTRSSTGQNFEEVWWNSLNVHSESSCVHSTAVARGSSDLNLRKAVAYSIGGELEAPMYEDHSVSWSSLSPRSLVPSEPVNPEASVSLSNLEPLDIPSTLQSSDVSVEHVVGVLNCPLGFRPQDPSVGCNRFDPVASECGVATKDEVGYKGTEEPSIQGGLITHLSAQVFCQPYG